MSSQKDNAVTTPEDLDVKSMYGGIYWAKSGSYPYWPCLVLDSNKLIAKWKKLGDRGRKAVVVFFGGDYKFSGIPFDKLEKWGEEPHHAKYIAQKMNPKLKDQLQYAVEEADEAVHEKTADRLAYELKEHFRLTKHEKARFEEWVEEQQQAMCSGCNDNQEQSCMLLCDALYCNRSYHMSCLDPMLEVVPEGEWVCPRCLDPDAEKKNKAKKDKIKKKAKEVTKKDKPGDKRLRALKAMKSLVCSFNLLEVDYSVCGDLEITNESKSSRLKRKREADEALKKKKKSRKEKEYRKLKKIMDSESDSSDEDGVDTVKQTLKDMKRLKRDLTTECASKFCDPSKVKGMLKQMAKMKDLTYGLLKISGIVKELQMLKQHRIEKVGKLCDKLVKHWRMKFAPEKKKGSISPTKTGSGNFGAKTPTYDRKSVKVSTASKRKISAVTTPEKQPQVKRIKIEKSSDAASNNATNKKVAQSVQESKLASVKPHMTTSIVVEDATGEIVISVRSKVRNNMIQWMVKCNELESESLVKSVAALEKLIFEKHCGDGMRYQKSMREVKFKVVGNDEAREALYSGRTTELKQLI